MVPTSSRRGFEMVLANDYLAFCLYFAQLVKQLMSLCHVGKFMVGVARKLVMC